jgi:hypothetical protein
MFVSDKNRATFAAALETTVSKKAVKNRLILSKK